MEIDSYLVGLFDGEGCITTALSARGVPHIHVQVVITVPEIALLFQEHWGGTVTARKISEGRRQMHVWRVTGRKARPALTTVARLGKIKNKQAQLGLELIDMSGPIGRGSFRITDEDLAKRILISDRIRSLNGARERFVQPGVVTKRRALTQIGG